MQKKPLLPFLFLLALAVGCRYDNLDDRANTDGDIKGCGDFAIYKIISSDQLLKVWIDQKKIAFSTEFQVFPDIAQAPFANIEIEQNCELEKIWYSSCNDVFQTPSCPSVHWALQSGKLSFKVNKVLDQYHCRETYLATVILENATFIKENSTDTLTFDAIELKNVMVGSCAG